MKATYLLNIGYLLREPLSLRVEVFQVVTPRSELKVVPLLSRFYRSQSLRRSEPWRVAGHDRTTGT